MELIIKRELSALEDSTVMVMITPDLSDLGKQRHLR
jgi:hypothetical protein